MSLFSPRRKLWGLGRSSTPRRRAQRGTPVQKKLAIELLENRIALATSIWSGAVDGLWSNNANWDTPPVAGNDLIFPSGAANLTNTNDLSAGTSFASLTVTGGGYSIGGAAINLSGGLTASQAAGTDTINLPINFTGPATVAVEQSGAVLVLGGVVSGTGGLSKQGAGELALEANNVYTGSTNVTAGVLGVDGAQGGSPVAMSAGTTLQGSGTIGSITSTSGTISPGGGAPAILTSAGALTLDAGSIYAVDLDGATAGTGYDQLSAAGPINLGGATLQPSLSGYTPSEGDSLVVVNNTGASAVVGTFAGLPQGAAVTVGDATFRINYSGGDGNDVVLTAALASTTSLAVSQSSTVFGQVVTLTATIDAVDETANETPGGIVEFFNGSTSLGSATISGGTAVLNVGTLPVGANQITAQYKGDANFAGSTSTASAVTVAQANTSTTLTAAPSSGVFGQTITLTAVVGAAAPGAGTPNGSVEFFNGATSLGTAVLTGGVAVLPTTSLPLGTSTITSKYLGSNDYVTSTSAASIVTIAQAATSTILTSSPNPSSAGQPTTLKATVAATAPGSGSPTGIVEFFNGADLLGTATLSGGVATLNTSALALGTYTITARYQGDGNYNASTSTALTQVVSPATTTTIASTSTSLTFGESVTLTATVASVDGTGTPTGDVIFMAGTTPVGTANVINGVATLTTTTLPGGVNSITAQYQGNASFGGSNSTPLTVTVAKANTTSVLTTTPNPSSLGASVTITVTISSTSTSSVKPSGNVTFFSDGVQIGTATAVNGVATLTSSSLTIGAHAITAQYDGDGNYNSSTAPAVTQTVKLASTTTLVASDQSTTYGESVTFTATVVATAGGSAVPSGTVNFLSNGVVIGSGTLVNGVATFTTNTLSGGSNLVTAQYQGDDSFGVSTSTGVTIAVTQAAITPTLTVGPNPSGFSQQVFLTASLPTAAPGAAAPTGTVEFFSGTTSLGTAPVVNGVATLSTTKLPLGSSAVTATYNGDANYLKATSAPVTASVTSTNTVVGLTSSLSNPTAYEAVTLTATVTPGGGGTGAPTGTVSFFTNGRFLGTGTLSNGVATLVTTELAVGDNAVVAVFNGDANFQPAASPVLSVNVGTQTEQFLNQVYVNSVGRQGTLEELDFFRTQLELGIPRRRVVGRIVNSVGGQSFAVQTVYRTFLRREATFREVLRGLTQARRTQGFAVEINVLGSREYFQTQGGGTIDGFATALYQDVLGAPITPSALNRLTRQLRQGTSRSSVAQSLVLSQQGKTAFVGFLYQQFFGAPPTAQQSARSVGLLNRGGFVSEVVVDILSSNDFYNRFVTG